ncbi:MAG: acetyltransferase [Promethearchaeota archaeon]
MLTLRKKPKKKKKIIIIGTGPFSEIAHEYFTHDSPYEVVAFSVEKDFLKENYFLGKPVIEFENLSSMYSPEKHELFTAITYRQLNRLRTRLYKMGKKKGFKFASYISSHSFVWKNVKIGENCFIFEDNTIQPFVKIGNNVILWSGNHIGHHSTIKDNCFISSHVVVSGFCEIGENCFFGVNSTVANNIKIAKDTIVGMNASIGYDTLEKKYYKSDLSKGIEFSKGILNFLKLKDIKELNILDKKLEGLN